MWNCIRHQQHPCHSRFLWKIDNLRAGKSRIKIQKAIHRIRAVPIINISPEKRLNSCERVERKSILLYFLRIDSEVRASVEWRQANVWLPFYCDQFFNSTFDFALSPKAVIDLWIYEMVDLPFHTNTARQWVNLLNLVRTTSTLPMKSFVFCSSGPCSSLRVQV